MRASPQVLLFSIAIFASSCTQNEASLIPLDERERNELGIIGIAAEDSAFQMSSQQLRRPPTSASRDPREVFVDIADGAYDGGKAGLSLGNFGCARYSCLLNTAIGLTGMTVGAITGGIGGAIQGTPYTEVPFDSDTDKASRQALQESIDSLGIPATLRDTILEKTQNYREHKFQLIQHLPPIPRKINDGYNYRLAKGRYWPLHEQGIQNLLKVRIRSIAFRRDGPEQPFTILIAFESALLQTTNGVCLRYRNWEYRGAQHTVAEWGNNEAALFRSELEKFVQTVATRIVRSFFDKPSTATQEDTNAAVIQVSESRSCESNS